MSQINHSTPKNEIAYLPVEQHIDREGLYQHLIKQCELKIGFHEQEIARQERLKKHYELHATAHKFYIERSIVERAD